MRTPGEAMGERNGAGPGMALATLNATRRSGMLALLVLLVVIVFVVPALPFDDRVLLLAIDIMMSLILVIGILAVADHRRIALLLSALSVVSIAVRWSATLASSELLPVIREISSLLALLVLAIAVGISVFGRGKPAVDRVVGAVVLYLMIGVNWAVAYALIDAVHPGSFTGGSGEALGIRHWTYFSFVTLTTVGYGDIVPAARVARSMAMVEALVGQLYPAVILARLVSLPQESP
jgi:Ion channel